MNDSEFEYDPAYLNALRELRVAVFFGVVSLLWTIGYCELFAYQPTDSVEPVSIVFGVPSWVMWGIAVPWTASGLFTIWFALFYIKEDDADLLAAEASLENTSTRSESLS